jgi:hypothetical protein
MEKAINKVTPIKKEPEEWEVQWQRCKPLIEKAVEYQDFYTIDDVEDKIRNGIALLWPGKETAIITEFAFFPKKKILHILCIAGKYEEVEKMLKSIENYAREIGINKITGSGRKGWLRKVKHLGFKQEYMISKEL